MVCSQYGWLDMWKHFYFICLLSSLCMCTGFSTCVQAFTSWEAAVLSTCVTLNVVCFCVFLSVLNENYSSERVYAMKVHFTKTCMTYFDGMGNTINEHKIHDDALRWCTRLLGKPYKYMFTNDSRKQGIVRQDTEKHQATDTSWKTCKHT